MFRGKFCIDAKLPRRHRDGYDFVTMELEREIPFVPVQGMMLMVVPHGDYFEVDEVYWSVNATAMLEVYFKDEQAGQPFKVSYLAKQGWSEQALPCK